MKHKQILVIHKICVQDDERYCGSCQYCMPYTELIGEAFCKLFACPLHNRYERCKWCLQSTEQEDCTQINDNLRENK